MNKDNRVLRIVLIASLVFLMGTGYIFTSANAALNESILNAPKPSKSSTPTPTHESQETAALSAINKVQKAKGCNFDLLAETVASSAGTCNILVVGDSLGNNLAYGMQRQLDKTTGIDLVVKSKSSTGLSNSWFY
jgi:hypothetical protein